MAPRSAVTEPLPPVLVAGAGPAGCAAALQLRRLGRPVVLVEAADFPRDKVCGDVLLPASVALIEDLTGALPEGAHRCGGLAYAGPGGRSFAGRFADRSGAAWPWWILRRSVFDAWLAGRAQAAGATLQQGRVLGVVRSAGGRVSGLTVRDASGATRRLAGCAVIGADGASSAVARAVSDEPPRPGRVAVAMRGYAEGPDLPRDRVEVYATRSVVPGCAWLVPVGDGVCNVGAGVVWTDARARSVPPRSLLERARSESPTLAARLRRAHVGRLQGWSLPLAGGRAKLAGDGWLLAGDAAALVDPLTGHGIHTALASGCLAAEALHAALAAGAPTARALQTYEREIRRRILRPARSRRVLQRLQAHAPFAELVAFAGSRSAPLREALTRLAGHVPQPQAVAGETGTGRLSGNASLFPFSGEAEP